MMHNDELIYIFWYNIVVSIFFHKETVRKKTTNFRIEMGANISLTFSAIFGAIFLLACELR